MLHLKQALSRGAGLLLGNMLRQDLGLYPLTSDDRLDNKQMEVLSAVLLCAERHNKEHVSWQYSAYKMPWRDYPVRKKSLVCPCLLH